MKKALVLCVTSVLIFLLSFGAAAFTADVDGNYLLTVGDGPKLRGVSVGARAEVYDNVLLDGSFLSVKEKDTDVSESLITVGGLYRVVTEPDLNVFVGLGFASFNDGTVGDDDDDAKAANGIYGKVGIKFNVAPGVNLLADLGYAPKLKAGEEDSGALLSARASVGYQVIDNVAVQVKVEHYSVANGEKKARTLFGGGVAVNF